MSVFEVFFSIGAGIGIGLFLLLVLPSVLLIKKAFK